MTDKITASRKRIFIDKKFQTKFILNYSLLIIIGTLVFNIAAYLILDSQIGKSLSSAHLAITRTGQLLLPTLVYLSIAFILILGTACIIITLLVSHKISGPLFAISRYLKMMADGNFNFEAKLRTRDQTAILAETLTETAKTIGGKIAVLKEATESLKKDLDESGALVSGKGCDQGQIIRLIHDLNEHVRVIEERLALFETE